MILSIRDDALAASDCTRLRRYGVPCAAAPAHAAIIKSYDSALVNAQDGFILTSQQAAYALPENGTHRPVFAVGRASAASARARGYHNVRCGPSDGAALAEIIRGAKAPNLCWLRAKKISFDMTAALEKADIIAQEAIVYEMQQQASWPPHIITALQAGDVSGIMVLSKAQRAALVQLLHHHNLWHLIAKIDLYVVSSTVAEAAQDDGWQTIHIARRKRALSVQAAVICHMRSP